MRISAVTRRRASYSRRHLEQRRNAGAWLFMSPQFIFFAGISLYPMIMSYVYSVFNWDGIGPLDVFIGLDNYRELLDSPEFGRSVVNSLVYTAAFTLFTVLAGLFLAIAVNSHLLKMRGLFRVALFLPVVTSTAIIGIVMQKMFSSRGAINVFLTDAGASESPVPWLLDPQLAMGVLVLVGTWKHVGITMIYWLTGLQAIPNEMYEAARIDRAGFWRILWHITLPQLRTLTGIIVLLTIMSSLHVFDLVFTLTEGGPYFSTQTMELFIYGYAFGTEFGPPRVGFAAAAGVLLGLIALAFTIVLFALTRIRRPSGQGQRGDE